MSTPPDEFITYVNTQLKTLIQTHTQIFDNSEVVQVGFVVHRVQVPEGGDHAQKINYAYVIKFNFSTSRFVEVLGNRVKILDYVIRHGVAPNTDLFTHRMTKQCCKSDFHYIYKIVVIDPSDTGKFATFKIHDTLY